MDTTKTLDAVMVSGVTRASLRYTPFNIGAGNAAGTEKWIFTITNRDGNIAQKQIVLTVQ